MPKGRGRSSPPPPRKPETPAELAPLIQKYVVKLTDKGMGEGADWPVIAETMALVMFRALDLAQDHPKTHSILNRLHAGSYDRITARSHDDIEAYQADKTPPPLVHSFKEPSGMDGPAPSEPS